jgi:putative inorganic carbon (HCO3(-)) transporter
MDAIALRYLHLESLLLIPFVLMGILTQIARSGESIHSLRNARLQVIGLLLGFAGLTAVFGAGLGSISPLLAVELAIGFTLALIHPVNALCLFVMMLFLRPWDILPTHPVLLALPRILAVTCFLSWFMHPWRHGRPGSRATHALWLLLGFSAWCFVSTFVTPNVADSQLAWFTTFFRSVVVFVMCAFFIENERSVAQFKYTVLISIFAIAVLGFYQYFAVNQERLAGVSMLDPNDLAAVSVIAVPLALMATFSRSQAFSQRVLGLLFLAVALLAIWYSQSRGALLALIAQVVGYQLLKHFPKRRFITVMVALLIGGSYMVMVGQLQREAGDMDASTESRLSYWTAAIRMAEHHPLFGVGYEQYPDNYESYASSMKFEWGKRAAHSSWLLAFAESGLLGGILFVCFFLTVFRAAWRNRDNHPDHLFALGGYAVAMSFLSHTYILFPYMLYGLILASDSVKEEAALES